ncbi:hypothetical protein [uncultured Gammaproteobacteria bacterium]|jgi:hypothetical protein|nr:hypothetical protein [uncultured Gammaproteobacteria bacterium]CAC9653240.1 hypothetical protein [uncultured Gammaproteobacteria bacterium]CAC9657606.1 hypothetical protein [uncultured Gammaproteobacteria bacterium]VVH58955.1 hypothetical protein BSPCLSOX_2782 [uncultured Gammaproteobacteria bacterium]VVH62776.1 hypothetical protein BSPWISOX_125 [uncultured Gammaproteobacteria bacterium]
MVSIDNEKLESVFRDMGVIFTSSGTIGFFFKFSLFGSIFAVIIGVFFILFGIKEDKHGTRN